MKRREALKAMAMTAVAATGLSAYDESLIVNKEDIKVENPENPSDFDAKHLPDIKISKEKDAKGYSLVEITIGQRDIIHPSDADHWIYEIDLYADDKLVSKANLEPVISRGCLSARVKLDGIKTLKSTARCNLHGNFTAVVKLA